MHLCAFSGFRISALRASTRTWIIFWNFHTALLRFVLSPVYFCFAFLRRCQTQRETEGFPATKQSKDDNGHESNHESVNHTSNTFGKNNLYCTFGLNRKTQVQLHMECSSKYCTTVFQSDVRRIQEIELKKNNKKQPLGKFRVSSNSFHQKTITKNNMQDVIVIKHFSDWIKFPSLHCKTHDPKSALPF